MIWVLLLLPLASFAHAQGDLELEAIKELEERLPREENLIRENLSDPRREKFLGALSKVRWSEISASGIEYVSIREGTSIVNLPRQVSVTVPKHIYSRAYRMADDLGHKYLIDVHGKVEYAVLAADIQSIQSVSNLHRPPHVYTPAPKRIKREYDGPLSLQPEARFSAGIARGAYFQDLFNEADPVTGISTHYSASVFSRWSLPIKVGLGFNFESTTYDLSNGGGIKYTSASVGPIFKSRELDLFFPTSFLAQFRMSPFSRMTSTTRFGNVGLRFNSSDFYLAAETPHMNSWGNFVTGIFFTTQWLSIRNQSLPVDLQANTDSNLAFGFTISQVFQ